MNANAETMTGALRQDEAPLFVINLCASTTPVALTQPNSPELKRYTFFVTRRREEGRERFRLHMGYFTCLLYTSPSPRDRTRSRMPSSA